MTGIDRRKFIVNASASAAGILAWHGKTLFQTNELCDLNEIVCTNLQDHEGNYIELPLWMAMSVN